jgi:hypothetical protein
VPDFEITVRVNGVEQDDADGLAMLMGLEASASPFKPLVGPPQRVDDRETRTEIGVRLEDGTVWPRDDRDAADLSARSITARGGHGQLVTRQVITTSWTEAEESA